MSSPRNCSITSAPRLTGSQCVQLFDSSYPMDVPNPNMIRAELNYAENLLLSHVNARSKTALAIISVVEPDASGDKNSTFIRSLTYDQLYIEVRNVSRALTKMGIVAGDRIVAFSPNNAEAAIAALAASTIGAGTFKFFSRPGFLQKFANSYRYPSSSSSSASSSASN
jgi:hypothetical protein